MDTTLRIAIIGAGCGMNYEGREVKAGWSDSRRSRSRGPEIASRYRYARKYAPPSYRGKSAGNPPRRLRVLRPRTDGLPVPWVQDLCQDGPQYDEAFGRRAR